MQRLQQLMSQPSPPEQEIKTLLTEMKRKRLEMLNLQQRKDDEETALLTPMQQARYLMYLMTLIKEARSIKSGGGRPGSRPARGRGRTQEVWADPGAWGCQPCGLPRSRFPVRLSKTGPGAGDPAPPLRHHSEKPASDPEFMRVFCRFFCLPTCQIPLKRFTINRLPEWWNW